MNKTVNFVNLLSKDQFLKDVKVAAVSPQFNLICLVSKQNEASIYQLPNNGDETPHWQCSSKTKQCLFSEDGKLLLFLLSVNTIQIYKVDDEATTLLLQIKTFVLASLLKDYNIDYLSVSKVIPLRLRRSELFVEVDNRLVCLEWGVAGNDPSVRYTILLPSYCDLNLSKNKLFLLEPNSHLNIYSLSNGHKNQEVLNLCLGNRANADISIGRSFSKFAVDVLGVVLAVVNQDQVTILFDITEAFDHVEKAKPAEEPKKEKWTWPGKRKSVSEAKGFPGKVLAQVQPLDGVVVSHLQFSLHGLFIFYSIMGSDSYSGFKVVDELTGNVFCTTDGLVEYSLVQGGCLPLFMSHSIISICLGALSFDTLVSTLCEIIPGFNGKDFEKNSQLSLKENFEVYTEFMKIVFSLHSNTFRASLKKLSSSGWRDEAIERKLIERVEILCNLALADERDDRVVKFVFLHVVHLLDLTCLTVKTTRGKTSLTRLESLVTILSRHLVELYRVIQHLDLFSYEWMVWRGLSDQEVVQEAVVLGTVALALTFFSCERNWDVAGAVEKFKNDTKEFVAQLITVGDLEKATLALNTLGCDPLEHFRELCLENNEPLLRDLLITYLRKADRVSAEEESAWRFCKQVESSLSTFVKTYRHFEHKMVVSASEKAVIIMINLVPFKGSLDLKTVLKQPLDWRKAVITELYFVTGDVTLESQLDKFICWMYLLEKNCIDLLTSWIDVSFADEKPQPSDYLTKMLLAFLSRWPVTPDMLDHVANADCMTATHSAVLDRSAQYGVFSTTEARDIGLVIHRLRNVCLLSKIGEILAKPTANVRLGDFYEWVLNESAKHGVKIPVISCLESANKNGELESGVELFQWLPVWQMFGNWDGNDLAVLGALIRESSTIVQVLPEDAPLLKIASALVEGKEVVEILEEEGPDCDLLQIPPIDICWQSLQRARTRPPDVTIYDLLAGSKLPVERLLAWQTENTYNKEPNVPDTFPHFNHQVLCAKLGHKQQLDYLYYLKQGQPSVACNLFTVESLRTHRRVSPQMINRACGLAHGLAIRLWRDQTIGTACVAFIAMLGEIQMANALRLHLGVISLIYEHLPANQQKFIGFLTFGIVSKDATQLQDMANLLETALIKSISGLDKISQLRKWSIAVMFCNLHGLAQPTLLPRALAKEGDWFNFILCLDLFKYSYELAIDLVEEMEQPILKAHFLRALTRTTLKLAATSPSKSPPRIHMDPDSGAEDDWNDEFRAYVDNIYSEVLTAIQSFTDRNIILPWSCEQNPDEDVLLTLLKYESEPDTGKSLLLAALELQSPILAVFSTCYQVENVAGPLLAWLLASVPTSLPRSRLREEGQLLPLDRNFNPELVQNLLLQFFATGYFQTFYRGMKLFMPDNPLTHVVEAIYRCVVGIDAAGALVALKAFVGDHGQTQVKDSVLAARDWVLGTSLRLIESILTRPDVRYSIKLLFLGVLADSEIASIDDAFPKFFLWHQISEILEPTKVCLNFAALYDLQTVSEEMERCLDELFSARAFSAALEISALLSLNKDRIVVAVWEQNFNEHLNGDVSKLWGESSAAFKDENVNPTLVSAFYYKMSSLFPPEATDSLRNKYLALKHCLVWRKLVEDTLLPSFREESDTIELEQWEICLSKDFDYSVLRGENVVEDFALLISQWPSPKLFVRAAVKTAPEPARVSGLIAALLDAGDLRSALRVSAFFTCDDQDLVTISSCLQVALGELPPSDLAQYSSMLSHPRKLLSPAVESITNPEGLEASTGREPPPVLALLERLCSSVAHGYALAQRIVVCVRLSFAVDVRFQELAAETNFLDLLERAIGAEYGSKLAIARDVLWLSGLPDNDLAQYLSKQIVRAISDGLLTGLDVPARLWDVNLENNFHRIISLMKNPAVLGQELLNASLQLQDPEAVEILIRAHDCYTVACNVEGIGLVLRRARVLAMQILQTHQRRLLVRLLIGIGRYGDMGYIFQMLKVNDQFEFLLRKKTAQAPGLSIAVSEFLQRTCPEDRKLGKMVALAFGLHGHQAAIWQEEADEIIAQLTPPLKDTGKMRQTLTLAMENYSNAAACYLEAGKMDKALKISKLAQIVALQISMLGGHFIININQQQLQHLAQDNLSVAHTIFLSEAKKMRIDWCAVIHERWLLHGDKTFFNDLKSHGILDAALITQYLQRYEKDAELVNRGKDRVKQLTNLLPTTPSSIFVKHLKSQ